MRKTAITIVILALLVILIISAFTIIELDKRIENKTRLSYNPNNSTISYSTSHYQKGPTSEPPTTLTYYQSGTCTK